MDANTLKTDHPDTFAKVGAEAVKSYLNSDEFKATIAKAVIGATDAEAERVKGIQSIAIPGHEALVKAMLEDGKTTPAEASMKIAAAEKQIRETGAAAAKADADKLAGIGETKPNDALETVDGGTGAGGVVVPVDEGGETAKTHPTYWATWIKDADLREEFGNTEDGFKRYVAFSKAEASGAAKIYGHPGAKK